jgi:hypothetical protein
MPLFSGVDWDNLLSITAPFVPQPDDSMDTVYFQGLQTVANGIKLFSYPRNSILNVHNHLNRTGLVLLFLVHMAVMTNRLYQPQLLTGPSCNLHVWAVHCYSSWLIVKWKVCFTFQRGFGGC